jgi:hypothetical protein
MTSQFSLKKETTLNMQNQEDYLKQQTSNKVKPRALILKAHDKDLEKLKKTIKNQFPDIEIVYFTTGTPASILRVIKSTPSETQKAAEQHSTPSNNTTFLGQWRVIGVSP